MINDIISGVTAAIGKEFGEGYEIYTENVEQGLKEPCFFVMVLEPSLKRYIGNRYLLTVPLDVHYFPAGKRQKADINDAVMRLQCILERISLLNGDLLNGSDMHFEIVEDVLHFFTTYKMVVKYSTEPVDDMGSFKFNGHIKGDE